MTRHPRDEFHVWLEDNPPPDLQALAAQHGGYGNITPKAWEYYDAAMANWQARRKDRLLGSRTWADMAGMKKSTTTKEQKARLKAAEKAAMPPPAKVQNT